MHALIPCTDCSRHVRGDANACPFCGSELVAVAIAPKRSARALTRAVIFASATLLAPACGGGSDEVTHEQDVDDPQGGGGEVLQTEGTDPDAIDGDTTDDQDATDTDDDVPIAQPYGAPPAEDFARIV